MMGTTMHGEYKTPGGKLVVADFSLHQGCLHEVMISGDFFLYPDEALATIVGALNGAPASASAAELAARVQAALDPTVTLFGVSPAAIGEAVRRGVVAG